MSIEEIYQLFLKHPAVSTDSRKIENGCLFFALKGENFNGNKYATDSISKGAAFAIVDEQEYQTSDRCILVNNVLETLQKLAAYHRKRNNFV